MKITAVSECKFVRSINVVGEKAKTYYQVCDVNGEIVIWYKRVTLETTIEKSSCQIVREGKGYRLTVDLFGIKLDTLTEINNSLMEMGFIRITTKETS
jgi:hypothetical protein